MWILVLSSFLAEPLKSSALRWDVTTADRVQPFAQLKQLDKQWKATIIAGDAIKTEELVALRRSDLPIPRFSNAPQLWLTGGDRLCGECRICTANELVFDVDLFLERRVKDVEDRSMKFPRTSLGILWLRSFDAQEMFHNYPWLKGPRKMDYILLTNGDTIQGVLGGLDRGKKEVRVERDGKPLLLPWERVHAIAFNTELTRNRIPATAYGNLVLQNGSRIRIASAEWKETQLVCETLLKKPLVIPLEELVALDVYQGKAIYLSDLKPAKYEYQSYLGETLPWAADQTVDGRPFQLHHPQGETTADKGIALHAPCTIRYALDAPYKRFEAVVGLDSRLGKRGDVRIQLQVDGKDVTPDALRTLTGANQSVPLSVNLENAKSLTIIVEMGNGGNVNDHVDWCHARLIR